jgi:Ras-related protein Rab-5C
MSIMTPKATLPRFKTVFLGETAVGKSSICLRLTRNKFDAYSEPTIGAAFLSFRNDEARLEIWDTAGQERYRSLAPMYYRGADACIMVYDVTNRQSFRKLRDWLAAICDQNEDPLVLILANKVDNENRTVSTEEGREYAKMVGAMYFETSAKTGQNVRQAGDRMIEQLTLRNKVKTPGVKKKGSVSITRTQSFALNKKLDTKCCGTS